MDTIITSLIPIAAILSVPLLMWIIMHFNTRRRSEIQQTMRALIQSGQPLSPELMEKLAADLDGNKVKYLRRGIIYSALAVGICLYGIFDEGLGARGSMDDVLEYIGLGAFLLCIGLAQLGLWKYLPDKP